MYKVAIIGSLFLVLCNSLTMLIYGGQRTSSCGLQTRLVPGDEGSCRGCKAGRLLHHEGDTPKNTRTCPLTEGRGGAHADSPRWQERETVPSQRPRLRSIPSGGPGGSRLLQTAEEADALLSRPPHSSRIQSPQEAPPSV